MTDLKEIINRFEPITLGEMDSLKLLNRVDTKFLFNAGRVPLILEDLMKHYRVLDVCGTRMNRYETLYYDTPGLHLYHQHHNGKMNRYKVRSRKYLDSGSGYFELKFKNNCGRTIKNRVKHETPDGELTGKPMKLIESKTPLDVRNLRPALSVFYTRITLVNRNLSERLTLDIGLNFRNELGEKAYPMIAIAEVKQDRSAKSEFHDMIRKYHLVRSGLSKYCLGICSLDGSVKQNNFKEKLMQLNKIGYEIS